VNSVAWHSGIDDGVSSTMLTFSLFGWVCLSVYLKEKMQICCCCLSSICSNSITAARLGSSGESGIGVVYLLLSVFALFFSWYDG
jgi:hypothetical protein